MTTAQDQQSRAEFERERVRHFKPGGPIAKALERYADGGYVDRRTEFAWAIWQAARALPAGMEPVGSVYTMQALVPGGREVAHVTLHQQLPAGTKLYTAAQVLAMGRLPPDQIPCRVNPLYRGPSHCQMGTARCTVESHRGRGRPPADMSQAQPVMYGAQAPTTGAGSVPAGASPAYRLLQRDIDTVQADDEFLRDDAVTWQADPQGIFVGMAYMSNVLRPARRAIEPSP